MTEQCSHARSLLSIMEQYRWGWNLYTLVGASRPYLVDTVDQFVGYPCSVEEELNDVLVQLKRDYDGPANHYLFCFDGVPTAGQFINLWLCKLSVDNISIIWCDTATRLAWQQQAVGTTIDEHHPGEVLPG